MSLGVRVQIMALFLVTPTLGDLVKLYRNSLYSLLCCKENTACLAKFIYIVLALLGACLT